MTEQRQFVIGQKLPVAGGGFRLGCDRARDTVLVQNFQRYLMGADLKEDPTFFDRADDHIRLANEHCSKVGRGKVSASLMYGSARFQAWNAACWADDTASMKASREETLQYFVDQYRAMLEENLDDYIEKFAEYMQNKDSSAG